MLRFYKSSPQAERRHKRNILSVKEKHKKIADAVKALDADVVLVNHQLTPAQTRNLESICQCRVVDRTGVILDIFAQRARSHEGKLQVELAQLSIYPLD